jgi:hypothetical protein
MESACSGKANTTARRASRDYSEQRDGRFGVKRLHECILYMTMQA